MKRILIEWYRFVKEGRTCSRCEQSSKAIQKVMRTMKTALMHMNADLELKEVLLSEEQLALSNTVIINGKSIAKILGEKEAGATFCPSCSELTGKRTCCNTFFYQEKTLDSLPAEMLQEAIIAEIGQQKLSGPKPGGGASCGCQ